MSDPDESVPGEDLVASSPPSRVGQVITGLGALGILVGAAGQLWKGGFGPGVLAWLLLAVVLVQRTRNGTGFDARRYRRESELLAEIEREGGIELSPGASRVEALARIEGARDLIEVHTRPDWHFPVLAVTAAVLLVFAAIATPGFFDVLGLPAWLLGLFVAVPGGIAIADLVRSPRRAARLNAILDDQVARLDDPPALTTPEDPSAPPA